jgi:O-methyltransferase
MLRQTIKGLFHRLGYEVRRVGSNGTPEKTDPDSVSARTVKEAEFYSIWTSPYPLFTPWIGHPDFLAFYRGVAEHTYVTPDRCYILLSLARHATLLDGDFAECGVCRGGTALLVSRLLDASARGRRFFLFDSFEGLPTTDADHDNYYKAGDFSFSDVDAIGRLLGSYDGITVKKGWIPETFQGLEPCRFSYVHVDVDLYQPTMDCCRFFYPRLVPGGVVVFDDYGFPSCRGEKDAADEFFADKPEKPFTLPTGQAVLIKS